MRIAYLGAPDSWYRSDLQRAAGAVHELRQAPFDSLHVAVVGGATVVRADSLPLTSCDAVIVRSMPPASLEQIVLRMDLLAAVEAQGVYVINPPRTLETAIDKCLTTMRLSAAGIATPTTHVSQDWHIALAAFHELGGDVVVKPLFGGEGRGITRISDEELAARAFKMLAQMGSVIYQQQFIAHEGCDLRLLVLGEHVWGMKRCHASDWRTNISRGATGSPVSVTGDLANLARRAARSLGAVFAGVDVLVGRDGTQWVIEVNGVPGWKALSQTLNVDIAAELLRYIEAVVQSRRGLPGATAHA
jgi:ribosomal protein S6--L-glutamate ligase